MSTRLTRRLDSALRLSPIDLGLLVGWRTREVARRLSDGLGRYQWMNARAQRVVGNALGGGQFRDWLTRPGAGQLWFEAPPARWAGHTFTDADRALADQAASGIFELLGSGAIPLGRPPEWRRDLYTGRPWPLNHSWRYPLHRGDGSDIRTVWELARGYHLVALGRAHWATGDPRYQAAFVEHVESWIQDNPVGYGPHWASAMDVAIRAANWTVAAYILAAESSIPEPFWHRLLQNLYASALYVERYLEWHPRFRGNHYLANAVGLLYVGALFAGLPEASRWRARGGEILAAEMERQVEADGVSFEAGIGYHRLATELFTYGGELIDRNGPTRLPKSYWARLQAMYRFIETYLWDDGRAPLLGDSDDGRLHLLSAEALLEPRRHRLGLPAGRFSTNGARHSAAFPDGGFYILRTSSGQMIVRCGRVGVAGAGSHDHNDQLSFELWFAGTLVVSDSGTYTYTRDLSLRHAFRRTSAHNVIQLGDEEQNPIAPELPWSVLRDRTRARCSRWAPGQGADEFEGLHHGYAERPSRAILRRQVLAVHREPRWVVTDDILGQGEESIVWRLHLGRLGLDVSGDGGEITVSLKHTPGICIRLSPPAGLSFAVEPSAASERYGCFHQRPCLVLRGQAALPARITCEFLLVGS